MLATHYQLPATSHQPPTTSRQPHAVRRTSPTSLVLQNKAHALKPSHMPGRAQRSPLGAERSDGPARPPLEAAPARAMAAAGKHSAACACIVLLTRGSCPSGAIADRKASSAAPPLSSPSQVCPERSEAKCRVADVGPPFFAYFLWRGKESKCAAGRISRPLRLGPTTKPGYGTQRQDESRKGHRGKPHRQAHCHPSRRQPHAGHPASHTTCPPQRHPSHIKKDSQP